MRSTCLLCAVLLVISLIVLCPWPSTATDEPTTLHEAEWCRILAEDLHGECEVRTYDGARVDILTDRYAIEVDWPHKWAEGVGQALFYGQAKARRPVCLLLIRDLEQERHYLNRAMIAGAAGGVEVWAWDCGRGEWIIGAGTVKTRVESRSAYQ